MSQAMQVLAPVARAVPAAGSIGGGAESPDSGQSFQSALAGQLASGESSAGDSGTAESAAPASAPDAVTDAIVPITAEFAASGNPLPPVLPPDQAVMADLVSGAEAPIAETAVPPTGTADDQPVISVVPETLADALLAASGVPVSIQPPVVLPATEGQAFSASAELPLNRPAVSNVAAHLRAAEDAHATLAANDLAAEAAASPTKSADVAVSLDAFRAALKEISPPAADTRSIPTAPQVPPGLLSANSFANALASGQSATAPTASATVPVPLGQAGWGQAFGNQVVWVVNQGMPAAQLHLSPPDLGPMSVRISMEQDQASLAFSSPHAMVREAIEAALPRLRDMLGSQGITLVDVNVSQHGSAHEQREPGEWRSAAAGAESASGPDNESDAGTRVAVGMLDIFV
jgi:flagellar hook-length control protein FliK